MNEEVYVGMGEYATTDGSQVLTALGLGSCIGCILYDRSNSYATMGHVMLPSSEGHENRDVLKTKFADVLVPILIQELVERGCRENDIVAKIAGGACLFKRAGEDSNINVGEKNTAAVKTILREKNIPIIAEDTGGTNGRTVRFFLENQKVTIKTKEGITEIWTTT